MIPMTGFAPDLDPATPGVLTDCTNLVPTLKGMAGAPTPLDAGAAALPSACRGAAVLSLLNNARRVLAGTQTGLYELTGATFTDRSKGGGYTGSTENRWRFAQFGNVSLACNQTERIQSSTAGAFADIATAPHARIIETAAGFVLAFGLNDAYVGGDRPDAWACSGLYDYATWTPAPTTQAQFGYLLDTPGEIRAAKRLGKDVAVYKERSTYLGRYVGPPVVWAFDLIAANAGAICQEAVIDTGTTHLFIGRDDFWLFDGSQPKAIGAPVKEWFFAHSDSTFRQNIRSYFDQYQNVAWWFYPANGASGALTDALVYNLNNGRWGHVKLDVQAVLLYQQPDTTYDDWPPGAATSFDAIPDYPLDSPVFDTSTAAMGVFGTDNKIKTLTGPAALCSLTTGDLGDEDQFTTLTRVTPRFLRLPSTTSLTHFTRDMAGGAFEQRSVEPINGSRYDPLASGRWHRLRIDCTGDFEIVGLQPSLIPDGDQ
jgi:hypothetical protein